MFFRVSSVQEGRGGVEVWWVRCCKLGLFAAWIPAKSWLKVQKPFYNPSLTLFRIFFHFYHHTVQMEHNI